MTVNFDFYELDIDYVEHLYNHDTNHQVFFNPSNPNYRDKPYIGVIVAFNDFKYFVPLTSAKPDFVNFKNTGKYHILIYETLKRKEINDTKDIFKVIEKNKLGITDEDIVKKIYSLISFSKAVPVPNGFYKKIKIIGHKNQALLSKEFRFCLSKKDTIINKAKSVIKEQHLTHQVHDGQCDYAALENVCKAWAFDKMEINLLKSELTLNKGDNINIETIVSVKNGVLQPCDIKTDEYGEFDYKICVQNEFGAQKFVNLRVNIKEA